MPVALATVSSWSETLTRPPPELRLVFLLQGIDQLIEVTVHDLRQTIKCQIDTVIGHAALRKVIGTDALGAVAAADLQAPRLRLGALLFLLLCGQQPCPQQCHGARAVLVL